MRKQSVSQPLRNFLSPNGRTPIVSIHFGTSILAILFWAIADPDALTFPLSKLLLRRSLVTRPGNRPVRMRISLDRKNRKERRGTQ